MSIERKKPPIKVAFLFELIGITNLVNRAGNINIEAKIRMSISF